MPEMRRVYVAGKLNDNAVGYIRNCHRMIQWAEAVRKLGFSVYVPCLDLLMGLQVGVFNYDDYFNNSQPWLDVSDVVFVCPGWEDSKGTRREIERAKENGIPVYYSLAELHEDKTNERV